MSIFGGIEAGGTKFVCAIASGPDDIKSETSFPTTTPDETIDRAIAFLQRNHESLSSVGIGSFGPVDLDRTSQTFGYITTTPKKGWRYTDFAGRVRRALKVPVIFDTDTNAAGLAEATWGAAQGLNTFVYVTVGTGIGGGGMVNGEALHGLSHSEVGHLRVPHNWAEDPYAGACPFHGDCLEGLAAGPALAGRWGQRGESLPPDHPAWQLEAHYLALGLANVIYTLSPQRIILGGGIMKQPSLLPLIRREVLSTLNDYLEIPAIKERINEYIVPPALGDKAGVLGAIALASASISQ
ncbi:MAG TPA: ROK family protein [Candidatus Acidoferrales bacterium]|nr:ROK family protein [Candidatus Acidoferrales bacterium]